MGSATVCLELVLLTAFINRTDKGMQHMFVASMSDMKTGCNCSSVGGQE